MFIIMFRDNVGNRVDQKVFSRDSMLNDNRDIIFTPVTLSTFTLLNTVQMSNI